MNQRTPATPKRAVTLADVAALAQVSAKTVSRVANQDAKVSRATRDRVEAAIRETGYQVNQAARSLAAARSYLIGAFMPNIPSFYHAEIFRGAAKACRQYGYHLVVEEYDYGSEIVRQSYEHGIRGAHCDALLLMPPICDDEALLDALDRDEVRYVRIAPAIQPERSTALFADDSRGVDQLARHLWERGRRRFALIAGPPDHASAAIRESTFLRTLESLGADMNDIRRARPEWQGPLVEVARSATFALLENPQRRPDAIFAFNDEAAIGAMGCARDLGLAIPDDISIAGFDDSFAAQLAWPRLTTVHQPIAELAAHAIKVIAERTDKAGNSIYLPTDIVIRKSS